MANDPYAVPEGMSWEMPKQKVDPYAVPEGMTYEMPNAEPEHLLALLHGFVRYLRGAQKGKWERTKR